MQSFSSTAKQVKISLREGHTYTLVITKAQSNVKLEFQHGTDPDWYTYPGVDGSKRDVIMMTFVPLSPIVRISFDSVPSSEWYATLTAQLVDVMQ